MNSILLRKSVVDVTRRKGRALLIILGILIGVLGLSLVNFASSLFNQDFRDYITPTNQPEIVFQLDQIPPDVLAQVMAMPNIAQVQTRTQLLTHWHTSAPNPALMAVYNYPDAQHILLTPYHLVSGHLPGPGEVALAGREQFIQSVQPSDTITLDNQYGQHVPLRVSGLVRTAETSSSNALVGLAYVSPQGLAQIAPDPQASITSFARGTGVGLSSQLMVQARKTDDSSMRQTYASLTLILNTHHILIMGSSLSDPSTNAGSQLMVTGLLQIASILSIFALLLVCVMILNTINTLLAEQLKVIGTMKALGGTRWQIVRSYLVSIGIYAAIGTALGLGLALLLSSQLSALVAQSARLDPTSTPPNYTSLLLSMATGLLVPLLAAVLPLWLGTQISVHEAMATYGMSSTGSARTHVWESKLSFIPQTVWLGFRGIFRRRMRAWFTITALVISAAIFASIQISNASLNQVTLHGIQIYNEDYRVDLGDASMPISATRTLTQIRALHNVGKAEIINEDLVTVANRELYVSALNAQTQLYQPHLVSGRWLRQNEMQSVVLSDIATGILHLSVGQRLNLVHSTGSMGGTQNTSWLIVGIAHENANTTGTADTTGRLGMAFTTLVNYNTMRRLPLDASNHIWVVAHDHSQAAMATLQQQITSVLNHDGLSHTYVRQDSTGGLTLILIIDAMFNIVAIIVALVGLLSLSNTIAASVLERRREIGILRSMGASGKRIGLIFWLEALVLSIIAWALGTMLGIPGGYGLVSLLQIYLQPTDFVLDPIFIVATLIFLIIVSLVSSFGPAFAASRVRIQETLRYE